MAATTPARGSTTHTPGSDARGGVHGAQPDDERRRAETLAAVTTLDGRFRRHKIMAGARVVACFNPANDPSASFLLRRPSLHPIYTPAGLPVTEQGAHNYPHHKGVFLVLGKINNTNLYVDTTHHSGRLEARETTFRLDGQALVMDTAIDWLDETGQILIAERRVHRFYVGELDGLANRIDIDSRLTTPLAAGADLPKNKHAYFHCRVIDAIDEEDGGTVRASNGVIGADRIFETDGYWIDTRGRIGPNAVGVTIMAHPSLAHSRCSRGRTALWRSIPSHARAAAWNRARSIARCTASGPTTSRTTWTWHARSRRLPRQQCCNAVTHARTATGPAAGLGEARVPR